MRKLDEKWLAAVCLEQTAKDRKIDDEELYPFSSEGMEQASRDYERWYSDQERDWADVIEKKEEEDWKEHEKDCAWAEWEDRDYD